jgi:hypothetical protein
LTLLTDTKKAWNFFAFIGAFEVFDYLNTPITTYKPTPIGGSAVAIFWSVIEVVEVPKAPDKPLRFSLFYGVHNSVMRFYS